MTEQQIENLEKLANYLEKGFLRAGVSFDMKRFSNIQDVDEENQLNCGTAGCAIGNAPDCGIEKMIGETWPEYMERQFGVNQKSEAFKQMFSSSWDFTRPTKYDCAKRIKTFLQNEKKKAQTVSNLPQTS